MKNITKKLENYNCNYIITTKIFFKSFVITS